MNPTRTKFPYGIADFQAIREEGYLYIDRTDRIPLLEETGKQILFLRPVASARACGSRPWKITMIWRAATASTGSSGG